MLVAAYIVGLLSGQPRLATMWPCCYQQVRVKPINDLALQGSVPSSYDETYGDSRLLEEDSPGR